MAAAEGESVVLFRPSGATTMAIQVPLGHCSFPEWHGSAKTDAKAWIGAYGGKPVVSLSGKPLFVELAIAQLLQDDGYEAWWVDSFGGRAEKPLFLPLPPDGIAPADLDSAGQPIDIFSAWRKDLRVKTLETVPEPVKDAFKSISAKAKTLRPGDHSARCWDVIALRDNQVRFIESKVGADVIRPSQERWLSAALAIGWPLKSFLVVEASVEDGAAK